MEGVTCASTEDIDIALVNAVEIAWSSNRNTLKEDGEDVVAESPFYVDIEPRNVDADNCSEYSEHNVFSSERVNSDSSILQQSRAHPDVEASSSVDIEPTKTDVAQGERNAEVADALKSDRRSILKQSRISLDAEAPFFVDIEPMALDAREGSVHGDRHARNTDIVKSGSRMRKDSRRLSVHDKPNEGKQRSCKQATLKIAGHSFASREDILAHLSSISAATPDGLLNMEDSFFLLHLVIGSFGFHHSFSSPVKGFKCCGSGLPHSNVSAEFFALLADGSQQRLNLNAKISTPDSGVFEGGHEEPIAECHPVLPVPIPFSNPCEWPRGTVLEVRGLFESTTKETVHAALLRFGKICYVEVLRIPPGARANNGLHSSDEEGDAAAEQGSLTTCKIDEPHAVRGPTATARCRFDDADSVVNAVGELREIAGAKVKASILSGKVEDAYWNRLAKQRHRKRDGPAAAAAVAKQRRKGLPLTALTAWRCACGLFSCNDSTHAT